ncbi:hypothetical protein FSP39_015351 [Pinctada imbricata]|uniref:Uncharacterized protein n=1 Tax=Pinctada imbricata TaxID=66713 RepID=A0AA88XMI5_PINIB|nr:hypothetical protein FSP39_015351 [Pinctada imbricata]
MDQNDKKTKRNRVSNAVMSKIYDEIGDALIDDKTKKSSSIKSTKGKSKGTKEEPGASKTVDGESALAGLSRGSYALLAEPKQTEITETDYACLAGNQNSKKSFKTKRETGHVEAKDGKKVVLRREKSRNQQQEIRVPSDYDTPPPLPTARGKEVTFQESDYQIPPKRMNITISSEEMQQHQTGAEDEKKR